MAASPTVATRARPPTSAASGYACPPTWLGGALAIFAQAASMPDLLTATAWPSWKKQGTLTRPSFPGRTALARRRPPRDQRERGLHISRQGRFSAGTTRPARGWAAAKEACHIAGRATCRVRARDQAG